MSVATTLAIYLLVRNRVVIEETYNKTYLIHFFLLNSATPPRYRYLKTGNSGLALQPKGSKTAEAFAVCFVISPWDQVIVFTGTV